MLAVAGPLVPVIDCEGPGGRRYAGHHQDALDDPGGDAPEGSLAHVVRVPKTQATGVTAGLEGVRADRPHGGGCGDVQRILVIRTWLSPRAWSYDRGRWRLVRYCLGAAPVPAAGPSARSFTTSLDSLRASTVSRLSATIQHVALCRTHGASRLNPSEQDSHGAGHGGGVLRDVLRMAWHARGQVLHATLTCTSSGPSLRCFDT
jgi:hypothetical protein